MRVVGLDHVQLAIPVGGEDAARTFYGEVLGLTEVSKPAPLDARGGCWFEAPATVVHLGVEDPFVPARKAHAAFLVDDLEVARGELEAAGAPVTPDDTLPDVRRLYTTDPFGNRVELIQRGDGFSERVTNG